MPEIQEQKPNILLTNDDGIDAEGMTLLREAIKNIGNIYVCAPANEMSAKSHSVNLKRPMTLETRETNGDVWGYALDGTPADCIKFALTHLKIPKPDLVISGINCGNNVGNSIYYSGTVGGAREAVMYGIPAIALSMSYNQQDPPNFDASVAFTPWVVLQTLKEKLPDYTFLNINIPSVTVDKIKGVAITRQGYSSYLDHYEESLDEHGNQTFLNTGSRFLGDEGLDETDAQALVDNQITVTPVQLDCTQYKTIDQLKKWLDPSLNQQFA